MSRCSHQILALKKVSHLTLLKSPVFEFSGEFVSTEDFSESDNIFVTLDGEQIPIYDMTVPHALCTHSMVNGYLKNHTSNGKGGCTVKVYTCQRCEKCGYLANAVYKNTITYAVCPH